MPRYIVERTVSGLTEDEWQAKGKKANEIIAEMGSEIIWVRSYISHAEGKVYCEYDAPSTAAVVQFSRLAGMPIDRISEIDLEISPSMFT